MAGLADVPAGRRDEAVSPVSPNYLVLSSFAADEATTEVTVQTEIVMHSIMNVLHALVDAAPDEELERMFAVDDAAWRGRISRCCRARMLTQK